MQKIIMLGIVIAVAGCQPKLEECWSENTKTSMMSLVRKNLLAQVESAVNSNKTKSVSAEDRAYYDKSLIVTIDTYHVAGRDWNSDSLSCGANVAMKYQLNNGKNIEATGASVPFHIYKAENGNVYSIENTLPLVGLFNRAN